MRMLRKLPPCVNVGRASFVRRAFTAPSRGKAAGPARAGLASSPLSGRGFFILSARVPAVLAIFAAIRRALAGMYAGRSEDTNLVGWFSQPLFAGEVRSAS
jgi:hypothetical protein